MKKLVSIFASFALAASMLGTPGLAFAASSTPSNTEFAQEVTDTGVVAESSDEVRDAAAVADKAAQIGAGIVSALADATNALMNGEDADDEDEAMTLQESLIANARDASQRSSIQLNFDSYLPRGASALALSMTLEAVSSEARTQGPIPLLRKDDAENGATTSFYALASGIPSGSYKMVVEGNGHAKYEQPLSVAPGKKATVTLIDSLVSDGVNLSCADENRTVGLQAYGDYTGDGIVNSDDSRHLVEVLANVSNPSMAHEYDFNGDGIFNLDDIQFFAATVKKTERGIAPCGNVRMTLDASDFTVTPGDDTAVSSSTGSGEPTWGVDDGTTAIIVNKDGSDIDTEHGVELTIETDGGRFQGIIIHSPLDEHGDPRNMPTEGFVTVYREDGATDTIPFNSNSGNVNEITGEVVIDFGEQLDVEKVSITIRGTSGPDPDKAEISYIEFIEDENGLSETFALDVPGNLRGIPEKSAFTVDWEGVAGATYYLLRITSPDGDTETITLHNTTYRAADFKGNPIINEQDYLVQVRAMGTKARSPWSAAITVTPTALVVPETPTELHLTGVTYSSISVAWNSAEGAATYELYYQEKGTSGSPAVIDGITDTACTIPGLKMGTYYEIYVVARNAKGPSKASSSQMTVKTDEVDVKVPWYNLINKNLTTLDPNDRHVNVIATTPADAVEAPGYASDQDHLNQVIDGNYDTFFHQDEADADPAGQTFEFDAAYPINSFAYTTRMDAAYDGIKDMTITVWDDNGVQVGEYSTANGDISIRPIPDADNSYFIMFPETNVKRMQVLSTREDGKPVTCSEIAFYESDHLDKYVDALFKDDTESALNDLGTIKKECAPTFNDAMSLQDIIDRLKKEIERTDPDSGEKVPSLRYDDLKSKLDKADVLADFEGEGARDLITINPAITATADGSLSALQPLGVTAKPGDEIEIYVASPTLQNGADTALRVVATQFDGNDGAWRANAQGAAPSDNLAVGINKITVPVVDSSVSKERGGALYIEYQGAPVVQSFGVRIKGGIDTAALDLAGVTDADEREARCLDYVNALRAQHDQLVDNESPHLTHGHSGSYDEHSCIANATDIASDALVLSLPATVVLQSLHTLSGGSNPANMAKALSAALSNMDKNMEMLYAQKGMAREFNADELAAYGANNYIPTSRVNLRYMSYDIAAKLMYAGADHVGIKWEYCDLLKDGKFSWSLLHEIGHILAPDSFEIDEVTPSYFALLTTAEGPDGSGNLTDLEWPFKYEDVYAHLVKTTKVSDLPDDLALALMWQLHLAFDGQPLAGAGSTGRFDTSVYARMGIFERNPNLAPAPGGIAMSTNAKSTWDVYIRLACAATGKNLLPFFDAWGIVYDTTTLAYAGQFQKFDKPIQYMTDSTSVYEKNGGVRASAKLREATDDDGHPNGFFYQTGTNAINMRFVSDADESQIIGYQVMRNGNVVALIKADPSLNGEHTIEYTDYVTQGNISYDYSVSIIDKTFYAGGAKRDLGTANVKYSEQLIANAGWSATTNISTGSNNTASIIGTPMNPCDPFTRHDAKNAIDGNDATVVTGTATDGNAQITIRLKDEAAVFGLKYAGGSSNSIEDFVIETSLNGETWTKAAEGSFESSSGVVYFKAGGNGVAESVDDAHIFLAGHVRLTAAGQQSASIAEIQLLGPLNDNISFFLDMDSMGSPSSIAGAGRYPDSSSSRGYKTLNIQRSHLAFVGDIEFYGDSTDDIVLVLVDQNGNRLVGKSAYHFVYSESAEVPRPQYWVYYFDSAQNPNDECKGSTFYHDAAWYPTLSNVTVQMYRANGATNIEDMILVSEYCSLYHAGRDILPALKHINTYVNPGDLDEEH